MMSLLFQELSFAPASRKYSKNNFTQSAGSNKDEKQKKGKKGKEEAVKKVPPKTQPRPKAAPNVVKKVEQPGAEGGPAGDEPPEHDDKVLILFFIST